MIDRDETEERERQTREWEKLRLADRMYPFACGISRNRHVRHRKVKLSLRVDPHVTAIIYQIIERDEPASLSMLFEDMLAAYLEKHGAITAADLPSDDVIIRKIEKEGLTDAARPCGKASNRP